MSPRFGIILLVTVAITVVSSVMPSYAQQTMTKEQLIGSWKVLSLKATTGDKVAYPLGEQVVRLRYHYHHAILAIVRRCDAEDSSCTDAD